MSPDSILLIQQEDNPNMLETLERQFKVRRVRDLSDVGRLAGEVMAIVLDISQQADMDRVFCDQLARREGIDPSVPMVLLSSSNELDDKLALFEMGFDDYLDADASSQEVCARISKVIMHRIASEQLKDRLQVANETAFSVMSDNSDLGLNIRFLLGVNHCDNLDQLGQLFFSSIEHYGISCSLQMRSAFETKNMDANGMARDLESQLLSHMKDQGRYVDFGHRSIVNYGRASLLVRNMPDLGSRRYGAIKDNTFALVQGLDARVRALDEHLRLQQEKQSLRKLSEDVQVVMRKIDESYQEVMRDIVTVVEDMSDKIQSRIPSLVLSEEQETFFETVAEECVMKTNGVFNQGLKVDEVFTKLSRDMAHALESLDAVEAMDAEEKPEENTSMSSNDSVELF